MLEQIRIMEMMNAPEPRRCTLTRRESDILLLLSQNLTDREIAERLVLSVHSVKWYARQIYGKLDVANRQEAVAKASALELFTRGTPPAKPAHNLPRQLTSFVGREKEIEQVTRMVREHPLVTLTGAGGVGKTRLALHAARELLDDFPDGVWLVELAPVIDPVFVPISVASVFNVHSASGQRLTQTLREHFASKCLLLIFDNCEHVIDAVAELSIHLLQGCPNLSILTTSREILDVEGEFFFRCPSLSLPGSSPAQVPSSMMKQVEASEAVRLFVDRAAAAVPDFCLNEKNAAAITKICQRLDGIPLAIELAAARLRFLSVEQVNSYMDDVFGLIAGSRRSAPPRHKTLKALIEWSYHLLSPSEQVLLRRLSVFAGGWTFPAAEAVTAGDGIAPDEVLDQMGHLVNKSLIRVEPVETGENRYDILETIRQYANEQLIVAGEKTRIRDRHLAFFSAAVERANPIDAHKYPGLPESQGLIREWNNIRLALNRAAETDALTGMRMMISFWKAAPFALDIELRQWMERLLAAEAEERIKLGSQQEEIERKLVRGRALLDLGGNSMFWGMRDQAAKALQESRAIFQSLGEPGDYFVAVASMDIGTLILSTDPEQSMLNLKSSWDTFNRLNEKTSLSDCDRILTALNLYLGNLEEARQFAEESLRLCKELGKEQSAALEYLGNVEFLKGNYDRASAFYEKLLESSQTYGELQWVSFSMSLQAWTAWAQENNERLCQLCDEMVRCGQETGCVNFFQSADIFQSLMDWAQGSYEQAARRAEAAVSAYKAEYGSFVVPLVYVLGRVALSRGDFLQAARYFRQMDEMSDGPRWKWRAYSLHMFGLLAAAQSRDRPDMAERAAVLLGAQEKLFSWLPNLFSPAEEREYAQALRVVKETLADEAFAAAWHRGQCMAHQQAFTFALVNGFEER